MKTLKTCFDHHKVSLSLKVYSIKIHNTQKCEKSIGRWLIDFDNKKLFSVLMTLEKSLLCFIASKKCWQLYLFHNCLRKKIEESTAWSQRLKFAVWGLSFEYVQTLEYLRTYNFYNTTHTQTFVCTVMFTMHNFMAQRLLGNIIIVNNIFVNQTSWG